MKRQQWLVLLGSIVLLLFAVGGAVYWVHAQQVAQRQAAALAYQQAHQETKITIREGWTIEDIATYLAQQQLVDYASFVQASKSTSLLYNTPEWKPVGTSMEGLLFPDTYNVYLHTTPQDILNKLLDNFGKKFTTKMQADLATQKRDPYQALILASIVEKEGKTLADKKMIAGIFWKRLDQGMRLQSDVTVQYLTKTTTEPNSDQLNINSPYNTYRHAGLPPTPICNPGLDSLMAVVYPTASDDWYFLATSTGEVKYATTYEDHLKLKAQYVTNQ